MSAFAQAISRPIPVYNQNKVNEIRNCMFHHPVSEPVETPKVFVLDDEGWKTYKKMMARIAKERKISKTKTVTNVSKKCIRDHRDETFEPIEYSVNNQIVRICTTTFSITKFKNFDEAVVGYQNVAKNEVLKTLRGDLSSFDNYFWIPVV
ncbi:hypothetical protein BST79_gp118 [Only Syngen Nebraska virus 5]|uniref:hypothetical protein n=1 Tax=Only Syngen Nebraska virus 5 TaxID=1917232 RepID=UPI000900E5E8|nr:hypothetical protein BST79_gp118 [Only Syngen Nebraska virus 5]APC25631.1 hypothetical protein [Only Syngen Nebraska virus 5]